MECQCGLHGLTSNNEICQPQAACGLKPKDSVVNIDVTDMDNELAAAEYIDDIYKFYKLTEVMLYACVLSLHLKRKRDLNFTE